MAARRPAKNQPDSFEWTKENAAWCAEQMKKYPEGRQASCVIPFLWRGQKQEGWVTIPMMEAIARQLAMPYIRVYEVATFYSMFNLVPVGKYHVQLCGTTPCMLRGAEDLKKVALDVVGEQMHVTEDGQLSWIEVECLGACCNAPMVQVSTDENDHYFEDLTPESFEQLLGKLRHDQPVEPGPQVSTRKKSEPEGAIRTLQDPALYDGSAARPIDKLPNSEPKPAEA